MSESERTIDPEDAKIITLARSVRARNRAAEGAAVRDLDGRTYTASSVGLASLPLTALQAAVVVAASSGAQGLEAAAVVTERAPDDVDVTVVADLGGAGTPVHVAAPDGTPISTRRA
ncbi:cytidine deaminase [Phytoactinopolyspora halotolerans]|uniref:Cytidine deaminase n=1 Tax=Phytoactinopolyspora halotolerans TaxID=1981512 RepID=A0A6L9S5W5_9ACTN|nr:cytidine deaminase [Phytoactinopolyspora halotolerans]NED99897.1 cytidine deaminase [Phytoactinopolyspora halotolerans]